MVVEGITVGRAATPYRFYLGALRSIQSQAFSSTIRASMEDKDKVCKELGLFSLRKKIGDVVLRAEILASTALDSEEARLIKQEQMIREYNLWDDLDKSNEILFELADCTKVVDALKDLRYKAEEARLITHLAEMDAINYRFFKQACNASVDLSKFLDLYEISKLLGGPYDMEGACVTIQAGAKGVYPEIWAERLLKMYIRWAKKHGHKGRVVEKYPAKGGGIKSAIVEFEYEYAYGYLCGETGIHRIFGNFHDGSLTSLALVDVIPLFLHTNSDLEVDDEDLLISSLSFSGEEKLISQTEPAVSIQHIPTGIKIQSSGERSHFANKIKALNRLKAKLLVIAKEKGISNVKNIKRDSIDSLLHQEARRYVFEPYKLVQDVKTGVQLPKLNSVLDGNIEALIGAHVSIRRGSDMI
ncbi:peptide chain release factor PrfB3, chloroplastic-like isoform X2 [Macadamia integrifolia]|uniref:peptide chain release factor PrfB3, chloroplastic-like isoform X2 n=1 Tax=Macadamia integrifolia TaxID=60698 RepID=UPI001C4E5876|nr:peptide chain release factor PrfB3, chloroplastic-like isoform X2 [Macadamia integrifolia]